ncbi:MAG: ROK family protein [Prevotellaceae bacterium]|nr:ROK family protein [Prevotellaceae bacterium]
MKNMYTIGIDVGGTTTKVGLVDKQGKVIQRALVITTNYPVISDYINALHEVIQLLITEAGGKDKIKGIGAGVPNGNYYTGEIVLAPNLPWKGVVPFGKMLSEQTGMPCKITNDANAAALGEMTYGAARGMKDFIMITLGTGVGSGIVANGQLIYGHDGFAGELGHVTVKPRGRLCGCGRRGCLETYASATGVVRSAMEMLSKNSTPSILRQLSPEEITSQKICDAAIQGDEVALKVFRFTGKILGEAFANFVAFSSPEAIVLFGGLTRAGNLLLDPLRESMEKNLLPIWQGQIRLLVSQLPESDAAIMGAASLI